VRKRVLQDDKNEKPEMKPEGLLSKLKEKRDNKGLALRVMDALLNGSSNSKGEQEDDQSKEGQNQDSE
jgi:hypothetical protein